jgi:hypothetical protein
MGRDDGDVLSLNVFSVLVPKCFLAFYFIFWNTKRCHSPLQTSFYHVLFKFYVLWQCSDEQGKMCAGGFEDLG